MQETILSLARTMTGGTEAEEPLLKLLCQAAEDGWRGRLRPGVTEADCGSAFACAAAFCAAAGLVRSRGGMESVASFTAGDVRVETGDGRAAAAAAEALCDQAERLMAPYTAWDDFAFCGVRT